MLKQRERVSRTAGETRQNFVVMKTPDFAGRTFDHDMPECYLPIATQRDVLSSAY